MKRYVLTVVTLMFIPAVMFAQPSKDERDFGKPGAMSLEELRREPITFALDIPYADTSNPRHRLDLYLPKNRRSDIAVTDKQIDALKYELYGLAEEEIRIVEGE